MTPIHRGKVAYGKLILENQSRYLVQLSKLEGKDIELIIRKKKSQRSLNQNSYYWGVVIVILGEHCGYEPEEMHTALRMKFLRKELIPGLQTAGTTTALDTTQFEDYLERVRRWASMDLNCFIPLPNEVMP